MHPWVGNALRLVLGAIFFLALPCAGYLWSQPDGRFLAILLGSGAAASLLAHEFLAWARENQARRLHGLLAEDEQDFVQWKERVRLLGGVVDILWKDNAELKQGHLVGEIQLLRRVKPAPSPPIVPKAIEDATADLLALPKLEPPETATPVRQE